MIRSIALTLTFAAALAFAANQLFARGGGGHGGGHHGGSHHSSHHSSHHGHHDHHASHHHHAAHYAHHNRPFTHGWYGHHGGAWGGWGWGWGGAWAPAAFGATAAWLGLNAADSVVGGYEPVQTVYTSDQGDNGDDSVDELPGQETAQDDNEVQPEEFAPATEAAALAKNGAFDPPQDAKLLPLGVYSLAPEGQEEASAMLQLSVSKDGVLRGSYYDLLSDQGHPIHGAVDKKTQRVAFTIGQHGKVLFETSLKNLTQDTGPLTVHYENGKARAWTIARFSGEGKEGEAAEGKEGTTQQTGETSVEGTVEPATK